MLIGDSGMRCSSLDFTAKPTPWLWRVLLWTPFQKKVYPAPPSVKESSPCSLVSLRAAMSMLYLVRSRATSAVLRWGLSGVSARSSTVWTFHEAMLSLFFTYIFWPRGGMLWRLRLTIQSVGSRQFLDHLFQVLPHHRGEQCGAAQSQWKLPKRRAAPSRGPKDHHSIAACVHGLARHSQPHLPPAPSLGSSLFTQSWESGWRASGRFHSPMSLHATSLGPTAAPRSHTA